jgi:hypothetical protein
VIPPLFKSAGLDNCASITDDLSGEDAPGFESTKFSIRGGGEMRLSVNTSRLEEKATACSMLYQYALELEEHFYPYVEQTLELMLPLVQYEFHEQVTSAVLMCMLQHSQNRLNACVYRFV